MLSSMLYLPGISNKAGCVVLMWGAPYPYLCIWAMEKNDFYPSPAVTVKLAPVLQRLNLYSAMGNVLLQCWDSRG